MRQSVTLLLAKHFLKNVFASAAVYVVGVLMMILLAFAAASGWKQYVMQNKLRQHYQQVARESWEGNPDKHPHRMAHYGTFAFRLKHPLTVFDFGIENFLGNAVFLEAHKTNTVNFSEASFSTSLVRFGEIRMAMILQVVLPLILFFFGHNAVTTERENGTLKILFNQGGDWKSIIIGKSLGLFTLAAIVYVPVMAITGVLLFMTDNGAVTTDVFLRFVAVALSYLLYMKLLCIVAVMVSAASKTSRDALIRLIGVWLFFVILFPKTMQAFGNYCYPSPSKVEFEAAIEEEILEKGDYHNPDDEHFTALRDSLLRTYRVDSVQQLPFNYSGFIMREGERISTEIYNRHTVRLMDRYQKQNRFARWPALVNPYTAIRNLSMALTGSDFYAYRNFQKQAEDYRYRLAQHMNTLQMELISNKKLGENDKPYSISREHWHEFPDFHYQHVPFGAALAAEMISLGALLVWCAGLLFYVQYYSKKATVIG